MGVRGVSWILCSLLMGTGALQYNHIHFAIALIPFLLLLADLQWMRPRLELGQLKEPPCLPLALQSKEPPLEGQEQDQVQRDEISTQRRYPAVPRVV